MPTETRKPNRTHTTPAGITVAISGSYGRHGKDRGFCGDFRVVVGTRVVMDGFGQIKAAKEWADRHEHILRTYA